MDKKYSYTDISKISGVSVATVSRALNNPTRVKANTFKKICEAIKLLNYEYISSIAPVGEAVRILVFCIPSISNPFYGKIANGARATAEGQGYQLLIYSGEINDTTFDQFIAMVKSVQALGVILLNHVETALLERLYHAVPVVQCCEYDEILPLPYVSVDDVSASQRVVEYMISCGCRKIALVNGPAYYKFSRHRREGYLNALNAAGLQANAIHIVQLSDVSYNMALSAALRLLNLTDRPDAFFAVSDIYAAAIIRACQSIGLRVPEDILVAGFDNVEYSVFTSPTITTVSQPQFKLGLIACEMLLELIKDPGCPVRRQQLETELIIRESTAKNASFADSVD